MTECQIQALQADSQLPKHKAPYVDIVFELLADRLADAVSCFTINGQQDWALWAVGRLRLEECGHRVGVHGGRHGCRYLLSWTRWQDRRFLVSRADRESRSITTQSLWGHGSADVQSQRIQPRHGHMGQVGASELGHWQAFGFRSAVGSAGTRRA